MNMDQTNILVTLCFAFVIGAGLGFYIARIIF
jgi:hypothetical protein